MNIYDLTHQLAQEIRSCPEVEERDRLKAVAEEDETNRTLLNEYRRLQSKLQMQAVSGGQTDPDEAERFRKIVSLLYMNSDVQAYLLSEMRLQTMLGDIFKILSEAAGMRIDLPSA